jgi:hypothetical protein
MMEKMPISETTRRAEQESETLKTMSCSELTTYLEQHLEILQDGRGAYVTSLMVNKECREVIPYLLRQTKSQDSYTKQQALRGLEKLECQEYRHIFVGSHLNDPDEEVRAGALICLCGLFRGERDREILRLALAAFDNPASSVEMCLTAGATMMYQLDIPHDEEGGPMWWNEEEQDLCHPAIVQAVAETRRLLAELPGHTTADCGVEDNR